MCWIYSSFSSTAPQRRTEWVRRARRVGVYECECECVESNSATKNTVAAGCGQTLLLLFYNGSRDWIKWCRWQHIAIAHRSCAHSLYLSFSVFLALGSFRILKRRASAILVSIFHACVAVWMCVCEGFSFTDFGFSMHGLRDVSGTKNHLRMDFIAVSNYMYLLYTRYIHRGRYTWIRFYEASRLFPHTNSIHTVRSFVRSCVLLYLYI